MFYRFVLIVLVAMSAGAVNAQRRSQKSESPRALTEEQVEVRLEELKSDLLLKVMPDTKKRGELQSRRWMESFHVVQTDHYILFTNASKTMSNKFARGMEDIYEFVRKQFPFEDVDELMTCYVFNMQEEYHNFCVAKGMSMREGQSTGGHSWEEATPQGGRRSYYATHYQSPTAPVVTHEASHQIVKVCLGVEGVGSWFQEGIAEYLEKKKANDKPSATMRTDLRNGDYHPLEAFFTIESMNQSPRNAATISVNPAIMARRNYEHAGALIDFLVNTKLKPVAGRFPEFLKKAKEKGYQRGGAASVKLIQDVYGLSPAELEELWRQHHRLRTRR